MDGGKRVLKGSHFLQNVIGRDIKELPVCRFMQNNLKAMLVQTKHNAERCTRRRKSGHRKGQQRARVPRTTRSFFFRQKMEMRDTVSGNRWPFKLMLVLTE